MGLRWQVAIAFTAFAAATLVLSIIPLGLFVAGSQVDWVADELTHRAELVAEQVSGPIEVDASRIIGRFPTESRFDALLLDGDLVPLGASSERVFPPPLEASELEEARPAAPVVERREFAGRDRLYVAVRLVPEDQVIGTLWVTVSLEPATALIRRMWIARVVVGVCVLLTAAGAGWMLAGRLTRRLNKLAEAARQYRVGGDETSIPADGPDEVAEVGRAFKEMAERLRHTLERQDEFVSTASHQLRTPLTSMWLRIDEIRIRGLDDPLAQEYLGELSDEAERLRSLVEQLLKLMSAGVPAEAAPVELRGVVETVLHRLRPLTNRRAVSVEVRMEPSIVVSARLGAVDEVLVNLVANALQHSLDHGVVVVRVEAREGYAVISVEDRGAGIPDNVLDRVFEPFYRGGDDSVGFGLGLAIAKRICDAAGAEISVGRRSVGGTVATVRWPLVTDPRPLEAGTALD